MSPSPSGYRYDERTGRYRAPNGRFVTRQAVRAEIDAALRATTERAKALAEQLRTGQIPLRQWQAGMREIIKDVHVYSAAAAKGGWAEMTPADYGRVGQLVREQYGYLQRFAREVARGYALDGRFTQRVQLYSQAGRRTYHQVERVEMRERGFDEEQNVLGVADHCDGCVAETARGWVPIGTLKPIGTRSCMSRCRCLIRYRKAGATPTRARRAA